MDPNSRNKSQGGNPYFQFQSRKRILIVLMACAAFVIAIYSMMNGAYYIDCGTILRTLFGQGDNIEKIVIFDIRLPRVIAAILIGCALAVSGTVMQCVLKNPLASPYTLGISNAAAFGAALAIMASYVGWGKTGVMHDILQSEYGMSIFAFVFSMVAVAVILGLSRLTIATPENMVLAGVALGSIFSAALSSLQYFANDETLASMVYWQFGDLSKAYWGDLSIVLVLLVPITLYFFYKRMDYNAMAAGDEVAQSLGINAKRTMITAMVLSSVLASVCISAVGIIGFVGLLGPHIMRRLIGNDHRFLIPASMIMGALILLIADSVGRLAFGNIVPVGILTSFLGGPLFIFILIKRRKGATQ